MFYLLFGANKYSAQTRQAIIAIQDKNKFEHNDIMCVCIYIIYILFHRCRCCCTQVMAE